MWRIFWHAGVPGPRRSRVCSNHPAIPFFSSSVQSPGAHSWRSLIGDPCRNQETCATPGNSPLRHPHLWIASQTGFPYRVVAVIVSDGNQAAQEENFRKSMICKNNLNHILHEIRYCRLSIWIILPAMRASATGKGSRSMGGGGDQALPGCAMSAVNWIAGEGRVQRVTPAPGRASHRLLLSPGNHCCGWCPPKAPAMPARSKRPPTSSWSGPVVCDLPVIAGVAQA